MRRFLINSSIFAVALAATPAMAQDAPATAEADTGGYGDIVVTAQKREENLQSVAAAISVVSGEQLDQRGVVNITSLQQLVPSLNFKDSATTLDSSVFLRGVGTINFSIAAEPSVGFVVDGVTYARSGEAFGDLYDIQRVEVLRGPQGTLFGKNASAGVISITTRRPGNELGGFVEAQATTDEEYKVRGAIDLPVSESIKTRFTANYGRFDGTVRNITLNRTVNGYERWGVRGMVVAEATPALTFTLIGDYRRQHSDCCAEVIGTAPAGALAASLAGVNLKGDETRQIRQNTLTFTRETSWGVSLQGDLDVGALGTLTSITAYRKYRNFGKRDGDFIDTVYNIAGGNQLDDFGPQPSKTFTQEIRLASPGHQTFEYVVGGFYYNAKQQRTFERDDIVCSATTLPPVAPGLAPCAAGSSTLRFPSAVGTFGSTIENYAIFGNLTFNVNDWFRLIGGGRYTHDNVDAFNRRTPATNGGGPGLLNVGADYKLHTSNNDFSWRAGAQFDVTDTWMLYGTYSQGYKGPAFNVFFNQNANQLAPIAAETADAYEAGSKFRTADGTFTLNTALFYAKYHNFQANSFVNLNGSVITQLTNAGDVSTRGVEVDALLRPARNFTLTGGLAFTDAHIDKFNLPPNSPPGSSTRQGERLPLAPKWKGNLGATWKIETGGFADIELGSQLSITSDQVSSLEPNPVTRRAITIDGYAILDANIALVDPNGVWRVNFIGRNLTDQSYATLITTGGPGGSFRYLLPRDVDRYFGVNARFNF
ncbi:TonB-dependent receptor [Sphingomonas tabacisoli]|uniref:TonB-dependent receptor n=1 Tax=Sphingomonas tabacisoli TaxID=2249466 RepID=A0ABW4I1Q9_9SPHN